MHTKYFNRENSELQFTSLDKLLKNKLYITEVVNLFQDNNNTEKNT